MRAENKVSEEGIVLEQASKAVRQLGSLMFEMEVLRSFLETSSELRYFDGRVNPAKKIAHRAVNRLKGFDKSFEIRYFSLVFLSSVSGASLQTRAHLR